MYPPRRRRCRCSNSSCPRADTLPQRRAGDRQVVEHVRVHVVGHVTDHCLHVCVVGREVLWRGARERSDHRPAAARPCRGRHHRGARRTDRRGLPTGKRTTHHGVGPARLSRIRRSAHAGGGQRRRCNRAVCLPRLAGDHPRQSRRECARCPDLIFQRAAGRPPARGPARRCRRTRRPGRSRGRADTPPPARRARPARPGRCA